MTPARRSGASSDPDPALSAAPRPALRINMAQSAYLDAIRGLAAQLVLLQHLFTACLPNSGLDGHGLGAVGVLVFFLLSGFLITDSVAARVAAGRYDAREFLIGRVARIYTPYLPAIALVAVADWFSSRSPAYAFGRDYNLHTALANVAMLQDFPLFQILRRLHVANRPWFVKSFGSGRQFWTVSIEWWIYVTVGLGTTLVLRNRRSGAPGAAFLAVLAFAAIEPLYNLVGGPGDALTLFWMTGGGAALLYRRFGRTLPSISGRIVPPCLAVLAGARLFFTHGVIYEPVFAMLLCGIMFSPLLHYRDAGAPGLATRLGLDRLSFPSYSLYLTHGSIVVLLILFCPGWTMGWRGLVLLVAVTNLFAIGFAAVFEAPHRRIRDLLLRRLTVAGALENRP
jgi:peptidoglycan/LPS O-acetylase OafA/YrhL